MLNNKIFSYPQFQLVKSDDHRTTGGISMKKSKKTKVKVNTVVVITLMLLIKVTVVFIFDDTTSDTTTPTNTGGFIQSETTAQSEITTNNTAVSESASPQDSDKNREPSYGVIFEGDITVEGDVHVNINTFDNIEFTATTPTDQ